LKIQGRDGDVAAADLGQHALRWLIERLLREIEGALVNAEALGR
jgi:hypothetical protein